MRQVRFEITDGICRPAGCETDDIGYAAISDAQCASEARKSSTASGGRISYGIVMTVTENGFNETTSFPDISFSRKKLRDFVSMLERNDVSPVHVEELIDDFFYARYTHRQSIRTERTTPKGSVRRTMTDRSKKMLRSVILYSLMDG